MSWMSDLIETYDNNIESIRVNDIKKSLIPICHTTQNAQIEIIIDEGGNFINARHVPKDDAVTLIPVTEESASKTSKPVPHPLCDKLCYIAGDYNHFIEGKDYSSAHLEYIENLDKWCNSPYTHNKIKAILKYVQKGSVIHDLLNEKILILDNHGKLSKKEKIQGISQTDAFVRFIVRSSEFVPTIEKVWEDEQLIENYIKYYTEQIEKKPTKDICYATGKYEVVTNKHPSGIIKSMGMAKLVSANDAQGFTYRGRFFDRNQAVSISYLASQKAHNALRWLIQNQGYTRDGAAIVAWAIDGTPIPDITKDSYDLFPNYLTGLDQTGESFANRLNKALEGYRVNLDTTKKVAVISLDSATPGRLSINYYRDIKGSDLLERIEKWQKDTWWHQRKYSPSENKSIDYSGSPSVRDIARLAFSTKKSVSESEQKLIRSTVERLITCIIDGSRIPIDIVRAAVNRVSYPLKMDNHKDWANALRWTCSLIKKHRIDRYKEVWNVSLDTTNTDRSYLFGRLLAVANHVEYLTMIGGSQRETNAIRYMATFSKRPGKTWKIIYEKLTPYFNRLPVSQKIKYQRLIDEIGALFQIEDFNNRPLSELYLLGYYSQNAAFSNKYEKIESEEDINE